jgi:hypothetical protein
MDEKGVDMFVLTYGEVVSQIIRDCNQQVPEINAKLEEL